MMMKRVQKVVRVVMKVVRVVMKMMMKMNSSNLKTHASILTKLKMNLTTKSTCSQELSIKDTGLTPKTSPAPWVKYPPPHQV